jgi:hypothetical protein
MGSNSRFDLNVYKEQLVMVYDSNGNFLDVMRDAPPLSGFKETISSGIGPLRVKLPRSFNRFDLIGTPNSRGTINQGNVIQYWLFGPNLPAGGLLRYQGVIDSYDPEIANSGEESVTITITPFSSVIADRSVTGTVAFGTVGSSGTYVDAVSQFNFWFNNNDPLNATKRYTDPLTLDGTNPATSGNKTQFTYQNQTLGSIWNSILLMLPQNWFYRINPDKTVTLNVPPVTAQHTLLVGQHCSTPQYRQDSTQRKNVVYFKGGGTVNSTKSGTSVSSLGVRAMLASDNRVTDSTTASTLAQGLLNFYDRPILRTKVRVPDNRGPNPNIGYDIETMKVGMSIQIIDPTINALVPTWDNSKWDVDYWDNAPGAAFSTISTIVSITYAFDYVDLEIGLPQPSQDRALFGIQQRFSDFTMI